MSIAPYKQILQRFADLRIIVVGDLMLDEYVFGIVRRISPEAPVPVVEWTEESFVPGGAANVVNNLLALGTQVSVFGVVGDDEKGRLLTSRLAESGADVQGVLTEPSRITTSKTRVIAHSQQVVRLDREQRQPLREDTQQELLHRLGEALPTAHAVVLSDYQKGGVDALAGAGHLGTVRVGRRDGHRKPEAFSPASPERGEAGVDEPARGTGFCQQPGQ